MGDLRIANWEATPKVLLVKIEVPFFGMEKSFYRRLVGIWGWHFNDTSGVRVGDVEDRLNELVLGHAVLSLVASQYEIRPAPVLNVPLGIEPSLDKVIADNE